MRTLFLIGLLVGCVQPDVDEVTVTTEQFIIPPVYDEEEQGRWLLGSVPDKLTNIATGEAHISVQRDHGNLRLSLDPTSNALQVLRISNLTVMQSGINVGATDVYFESNNGIPIRITGTETDAWGGYVYLLQYQEAMNQTWVDYCEGGEGAVAMQGVWTSTGFHKNTTNDISFGCRDAVTYKCFDWGYDPGPYSTTVTQRLAWDLHQACTRMGRADICGDGITHTREETPIVIRDRVTGYNPGPNADPPLEHITEMPPPPDRHYFESAWVAGENMGAVCLEKQRWTSLPVGFSCGQLTDPRTTGAMYCGEMSNDHLNTAGAWLVNASKTYDMHLHLWKNDKTGDVVSTIRGYYSEGPENEPPFAGYERHLGTDGILLRNAPGSVLLDDLVEVFSTGTSDRVLSPNDQLTRKDSTFEGYLFKYGGTDRTRYNLFRRAGVDALTGIRPLDSTYLYESPMFFVITPP